MGRETSGSDANQSPGLAAVRAAVERLGFDLPALVAEVSLWVPPEAHRRHVTPENPSGAVYPTVRRARPGSGERAGDAGRVHAGECAEWTAKVFEHRYEVIPPLTLFSLSIRTEYRRYVRNRLHKAISLSEYSSIAHPPQDVSIGARRERSTLDGQLDERLMGGARGEARHRGRAGAGRAGSAVSAGERMERALQAKDGSLERPCPDGARSPAQGTSIQTRSN